MSIAEHDSGGECLQALLWESGVVALVLQQLQG